MSITGPVPTNLPNYQTDANTLALRAQERISAEVLHIAGDRVLLSVDGVRLVARMTTSDQTAQLAERRQAQFIVKDLSQEVLTLQLVTQGGEQNSPSSPISIIPMLLEQSGLKIDQTNVLIAQALLQEGLQVDADLINELRSVLLAAGDVSLETAQLAAAIKAEGIPVSPQALAMLLNHTPQLAESLQSLIKTVFFAARKRYEGVPDIHFDEALKNLQAFFIDLSASPEEISAQLEKLFSILGRSLENRLLELIRDGSPSIAQDFQADELMKLVHLYQAVHQHPELQYLRKELGNFFDSLRLLQYTNTEPDPESQHAGWLRVELPFAAHTSQAPYVLASEQTGQLRIAYRRDEQGARRIDPRHTRMVIATGLGKDDILEIDLSIVHQNVKANVAASNLPLQKIASDEIPQLKNDLADRGYTVQSSTCVVDAGLTMPDRFEIEPVSSPVMQQTTYTKVNLEA